MRQRNARRIPTLLPIPLVLLAHSAIIPDHVLAISCLTGPAHLLARHQLLRFHRQILLLSPCVLLDAVSQLRELFEKSGRLDELREVARGD